ncbi:sirohydrochlorin cobaltochelatase [Holophaga foetida]|uniref:sirohydrochlorin cobaltochelatase n=1 Tax=Holophaga foetida TaxID=35839 RepID=UPI0002471CF3|nr:sirohydrochlorin cobaltochelatase [Holophaga foetida]
MTTPILIVAFGAMSSAARVAYEHFDAEVRLAFPGREIVWAYTAKSLVARLQAKGEKVQLLSEAYADLKARGFRNVALLSLHLVPGEQHQGILAEDTRGLEVSYAGPLLGTPADIEAIAQCLGAELPQDRPVMVVAHGHAHEAKFNEELKALADRLGQLHPDLLMTRLEGDDAPEALDAFMGRARVAGKVHVDPFLYVAGDHVRNDILGEEEDSLKSRLGVSDFGFGAVLGERPWVRHHFIEQLRNALETA